MWLVATILDNAIAEKCELGSWKTSGLGLSGARAFPPAAGTEVPPSLLPLGRFSLH